MTRPILSAAAVVMFGIAAAVAAICSAPAAEPNREDCTKAVEKARTLAMAMPAGDLSRLFAERHLHQAMVEAGNGEFDECLEWVDRANEEIRDRPHALRPGETLKILGPDEIPPPPK